MSFLKQFLVCFFIYFDVQALLYSIVAFSLPRNMTPTPHLPLPLPIGPAQPSPPAPASHNASHND